MVICEGVTEQRFCHMVLSPYVASWCIGIETPLIKRSHGGLVSWEILRRDIGVCLRQDSTVIVSMLIDWYGIKPSDKFPKWIKDGKLPLYEQVRMVEEAMRIEVEEDLRKENEDLCDRFIPNFLVHEFEALLFSNESAILARFPAFRIKDRGELEGIYRKFSNPELINNSKETSPSHRLNRIVGGYSKVIDGPPLAKSIGIPTMRAKAPHFNGWVETLISAASTQASITQ